MEWLTHEVSNQVPPLVDVNLYLTDTVLRDAILAAGATGRHDALTALGARAGSAEVHAWAAMANRHIPTLQTHDSVGRRIDRVEFHPAWHALLGWLRQEGMQAKAWLSSAPDAHLGRTAGFFLHAQVEAGSLCPITMTNAAVPVLQKEPALFAQLQPKLICSEHDSRDLPLEQKSAVLIGMGMTEKQGGSDVRSNSTRARPIGAEGRGHAYQITGHKWFFSAPMSDAHLVLAQTSSGLSCFFIPRWQPDGSKNAVLLQQLKDKVGNRSNASSEVEFQAAWGLMVGEEGRGIPTIIEMANSTRLDCVIGSAALMRQALVQALHHASHRHAFGKPLIEQPLMRNVLCDLALESEAATRLMLRLASSLDRADSPLERAWRRIMTPAAKFWVCKRALAFTGECMEIWGGNGYVESGPMGRLYREAPVNSIWEGSGNIMCLDVLRAIERDREAFQYLMASLEPACAAFAGLHDLQVRLQKYARLEPLEREASGRYFVQDLVLLTQAALMLESAPTAIADMFVTSRINVANGRIFGCLAGAHAQGQGHMLLRAWPQT